MKKVFLAALLFCVQFVFAQTESTSEFIITGKVKAERKIGLQDLLQLPSVELNDVNTSCSPRKETKVKKAKAVLIKNVLDSVVFDYDKSHSLGSYYFLFVAADGYKVVYSFNEIYNTEIGNHTYIITAIDDKPLQEIDNRILMITTTDIKGGSRNLKYLSKIVVCKAEWEKYRF